MRDALAREAAGGDRDARGRGNFMIGVGVRTRLDVSATDRGGETRCRSVSCGRAAGTGMREENPSRHIPAWPRATVRSRIALRRRCPRARRIRRPWRPCGRRVRLSHRQRHEPGCVVVLAPQGQTEAAHAHHCESHRIVRAQAPCLVRHLDAAHRIAGVHQCESQSVLTDERKRGQSAFPSFYRFICPPPETPSVPPSADTPRSPPAAESSLA